MIQVFVDTFMEKKPELRAAFSVKHPEGYKHLVTAVVQFLADVGDGDYSMDPSKIHEIDDGDYQGTLLYLIPAMTYQPSEYWFVRVGYGSCSSCDTLESIRDCGDDPPTERQVDEYMTLALHVVQGLKKLPSDGDE